MALVEFQNVTRVYKTGDHELKALDGESFRLLKQLLLSIFV